MRQEVTENPLEAQCIFDRMHTMWKLFTINISAIEELAKSDKWLLYSGILFGSSRHHEIIPRDDYNDFIMSFEVRKALQEKVHRSPSKLHTSNVDLLRRRPLEWQTFVVHTGQNIEQRRRLPNLENLPWPEREYLPSPLGAPGTRPLPLGAQFSRQQMRTVWNPFNTFVNVMEDLVFSDKWMLYGGARLGSFQHHYIIRRQGGQTGVVEEDAHPPAR
ncbi:unnamed protein product [Dibothriocephalus latus]|uniref:Uncharacterized protein n=1 Tax=Dibothriocephalus latus TaxID=60516 RepID=A0A3P7LGY6_DIBLA|nr:unnamed protein product [Dibothriocephalus latus]